MFLANLNNSRNYGCLRAVSYSLPTFPKDSTVYVDIDLRIWNTPQYNQIVAGLSSWNGSNQINGSGITYNLNGVPTGPGQYNILHVLNTTLYLQDGVTVDTATVARMSPGVVNSTTGTMSEATIFFNTGGARASVDPSSPMYNQPYFQPGQPGYDTVFRKNTEHETGHAEGLCHPLRKNQVAGQSVMNQAVANCPNDNCNRQPVGVQPCDTNAVRTVTTYQPTPTPTPTPAPVTGGGGLTYCEMYPSSCSGGGYYGGGFGGRVCYSVYEPHYYYGGVAGDPTWDVTVEYEFLYSYCSY